MAARTCVVRPIKSATGDDAQSPVNSHSERLACATPMISFGFGRWNANSSHTFNTAKEAAEVVPSAACISA